MKHKIVSLVVLIALAASCLIVFPDPAAAKTEYSEAAASLVVNILNPDGTTTLVHEYTGVIAGTYTVYDSTQSQNVTFTYYTYPELEELASVEYYASIDAMPAAVGTKALGVTINDLVSDAQQYNPDLKWESGQSLRLYPTDASGYPYQGNNFYNYDFIQGQDRYYYPNLVESYTAFRMNDEDTSYLENALDDPEPVEPMICLSIYEERYATDELLKTRNQGEYTLKPNDDPDDWRTITTPVEMNSHESLSFCMGLTPDEAQDGINNSYSSTNKFCKWIYQIDIGPLKGPSLTSDRTDNDLGQPIEITFPDSEDWRNGITDITVDGETVAADNYTIEAGVITLDDTVFTSSGSFVVIIASTGFMDARVTQAIQTDSTVAVTGVYLNKSADTITVGKTAQMTVIIEPEDATNQDVTWSSNNEAVAIVEDGLVTAQSAGTATITVTTVDGGKKASCIITAKKTSSSGGGGGGSSSSSSTSTSTVVLSGLVSNTTVLLNSEGLTQNACRLTSADENIVLDINSGTRLITSSFGILTSLSLEAIAEPADLPESSALLSAFQLGPAGSTASPSLNLTVHLGELPENADVETVRVLQWNDSAWEAIGGSLDTEGTSVSVQITCLTAYAVIIDIPEPADFLLSDLMVNPVSVAPGEVVTVQATLSNQGGMSGSCTISFRVNDVEINSQDVQLDPGSEQTIEFQVQQDEPGDYRVSINDKDGQFNVVASPASTEAATPTGTTAGSSIATTVASLVEQSETSVITGVTDENTGAASGADNLSKSDNRLWIGAIIAALVLVIVILVIIRHRNKSGGVKPQKRIS